MHILTCAVRVSYINKLLTKSLARPQLTSFQYVSCTNKLFNKSLTQSLMVDTFLAGL